MRVARLLSWFLVGLALGGYAVISHADTIPETPGTYTITYAPNNQCLASITNTYSTAQQAYSAWLSQWPKTSPCTDVYTRSLVSSSLSGTTITYAYDVNTPTVQHYTGLTKTFTANPATCPAGYTGPDANHNCTSSAPDPACGLSVGTVLYSGYFDIGTSPSGSPPSTICKTHCVGVSYLSGPAASALVNGVRHYYYEGEYQVDQSGVAGYCATDTPTTDVNNSGSTVPAPTCASGQSVGYVNGQALCYTPGTPPAPNTAPPATETKKAPVVTQEPDGSTTTKDETTHADGSTTVVITNCLAGACTTTTTETAPADPLAADEFCRNNPTADVCVKNKTDCDLHPDAVGCQKLDTDGLNMPSLPTQSINIQSASAPVDMGADNATCPAPRAIHVPVLNSTIYFPYDRFCEFLEKIRPLVIAMCSLIALYIVIGHRGST